jgi:hypothetical protein
MTTLSTWINNSWQENIAVQLSTLAESHSVQEINACSSITDSPHLKICQQVPFVSENKAKS